MVRDEPQWLLGKQRSLSAAPQDVWVLDERDLLGEEEPTDRNIRTLILFLLPRTCDRKYYKDAAQYQAV